VSRNRKFFVTVTRDGSVTTVERLERSEQRLHRRLVKEFGEGVSFQWSERSAPRPIERHMTDADWEAEGRRIVLESMDLPDGAYFAMADELGIDPY
jgi:hypothetical protein